MAEKKDEEEKKETGENNDLNIFLGNFQKEEKYESKKGSLFFYFYSFLRYNIKDGIRWIKK